MIRILETYPKDMKVANIAKNCHSYRGYYSDLAFEHGETTVADLLKCCRKAIGSTFVGYKGGEYVMDEHTSVYVAEYGCCGRILCGFMQTFSDDELVLSAVTEEEVW